MDSELIKIIGEKKYPLLALLNQCDRIEEIPQIILNSYKWKKTSSAFYQEDKYLNGKRFKMKISPFKLPRRKILISW